MSCQQLRNDFVPFLLGELAPNSARGIAEHLADGCSSCHDEFQALRDAVELVFSAVPAAPATVEQHQHILQLALRKASPIVSTPRFTQSSSPEIQSLSHGILTPGRLLQALLTFAAGFFLVVSWQALRTNLQTSEQPAAVQHSGTEYNAAAIGKAAAALSGDPQMLPRAHDAVHFVSLKVQPTQPSLAGYFLADPFSGELHVVGNIVRPPQPYEQFQLSLKTDQTVVHVRVTIDPSGRFKVILPLPPAAIREVMLTASGVSN